MSRIFFSTLGFEEKCFLDIFTKEQVTQRMSVIPSPLVSAPVFMNVSYSVDQYNFILNSGNARLEVLFFLKFHSLGSFVVLHELILVSM